MQNSISLNLSFINTHTYTHTHLNYIFRFQRRNPINPTLAFWNWLIRFFPWSPLGIAYTPFHVSFPHSRLRTSSPLKDSVFLFMSLFTLTSLGLSPVVLCISISFCPLGQQQTPHHSILQAVSCWLYGTRATMCPEGTRLLVRVILTRLRIYTQMRYCTILDHKVW